jgi:hypothetical protein
MDRSPQRFKVLAVDDSAIYRKLVEQSLPQERTFSPRGICQPRSMSNGAWKKMFSSLIPVRCFTTKTLRSSVSQKISRNKLYKDAPKTGEVYSAARVFHPAP